MEITLDYKSKIILTVEQPNICVALGRWYFKMKNEFSGESTLIGPFATDEAAAVALARLKCILEA